MTEIDPAAAAAAATRRSIGERLQSLWRSFSGIGLIIGAIFLAASLTPSLIPRSHILQGALAGITFAVGYGLGNLLVGLWRFFELPRSADRILRPATWTAAGASAILVLAALWRAAAWQNSIRLRMDMPPVESSRPFEVALIALVVFGFLMLLARIFLVLYRLVERRASRHVPVRVARGVGLVAAIVVFFSVIDGVLVRGFLTLADTSARALDALIEPDTKAPTDPMKTGSSASLLAWERLGRTGRDFIATGPTAAEIGAETRRAAKEPIRVYVGLNSADNADDRAALAVREMLRVGAFDRKVLIVVTPTGTGWMDPAAMDTVEYLHDGDTAIVAQQYSYLTSWISLLVEPGNSAEAGRALFRAVYHHWTHMPKDHRPKLYLQGLSLGAYGSDQSFRLHEVLADPFNGAVWSGPPFSTPGWRAATLEREPGSPEWLPTYGDGSVIRFTNQEDHTGVAAAAWGPLRIVYLQYASDPITFFDPNSLWRKPDWMNAPVGPDVSPDLHWYPVVTFLQLVLDMAIALAVPIGHGHYYAPQHYIDAWMAVTDPAGWTPETIAALKAHFAVPVEPKG